MLALGSIDIKVQIKIIWIMGRKQIYGFSSTFTVAFIKFLATAGGRGALTLRDLFSNNVGSSLTLTLPNLTKSKHENLL